MVSMQREHLNSGRKRKLFDVILTIPMVFCAAPMIGAIAAVVYFKQGSPVFFRQIRPGFHGKPFELFKFRTMVDGWDQEGNPLSDEKRLTSFGNWLRGTSLDELPELFNVLKGDMSLVGPGPLLMEYLDRYTLEQARRHEVRSGITGWAQVNGRNGLTWEEKFKLDLWYVDNWSIWLDLKIIAMTIWKILKQEGINQPGHATAEEFVGNEITANLNGSNDG